MDEPPPLFLPPSAHVNNNSYLTYNPSVNMYTTSAASATAASPLSNTAYPASGKRPHNPYSTEYDMTNANMMTEQIPLAGGQRSPSPPSNSINPNPLSSTLQVQPPSQNDGQIHAHGQVPCAPPVTAQTAAVTSNTSQFAGDHRYPPVRPPIQQPHTTTDTGYYRNQITASALAAWGPDMPRADTANPEAAFQRLSRMFEMLPVASDPHRPKQKQEPQKRVDSTEWRCDPESFRDPECEIHVLADHDRDALAGDPRRGRFLTKREMNRRHDKARAGGDRPAALVSPPNRRVPAGTPVGSCPQAGFAPSDAADPAAASPQAPTLRLTRQVDQKVAAATITILLPDDVDIYAQRRQPETGEALPGMSVDRGPPYRTPTDVVHLDLLLRGKGWVENQALWADRAIKSIIECWTRERKDQVSMTVEFRRGQVAQTEPRFAFIEEDGASASLLRIGNAPHGAEGDTLVSGMDAGVAGGGLRDQVRMAQESVVGERDQTVWPALSTHPNRQVGKLQTPTAASALSETAPHSNPHRRRRGGGRRRKTTPPLSAPAGDLGEATEKQVGMPQPPAAMPALSDRAPSSDPHRRRRRGGRRRKDPPLPSTAAGGERGRDYSRGVQILPSLELAAAERTAAAEADSRPREEDAEVALRASPVHGSTVPVHQQETALPLLQGVLGSGTVDPPEQAGSNHWRDSPGSCRVALSQRREFQSKKAGGSTPAALAEDMRVSSGRGRQIGLTGQRQPPPVTTQQGTHEMACAAGELACMGMAGAMSANLPAQAAILAAERYYGRGSPAGRRRRRGRGRRRRGRGLLRDAGQAGTSGAQGVGSPSLLGGIDLGSVNRTGGAGRGEAAAGLLAAGVERAAALPSGTGESPPRPDRQWRSLPGLTERWKRHDPPSAVTGSGEDAPRIVEKPWIGSEQGVGPSEPSSIPDSIEARIVSKGMPLCVEIRLEDWALMQSVGLGTHPDLAVTFAWRRCSGPSIGGGHKVLPTIQLVSREELDIPKPFWPTSWEGLVNHVEQGGFFRTVVAMRGGMDPSVAQQQLDSIDFRQNIDWDETDRCLGRVRAGEVIAPPEITNYMMMAQLLAASTVLQQWDSLAVFLGTLPPELREGLIISPARLAALAAIVARPKPEPAGPPQWIQANLFVELRFHHLSLSDFVLDPVRVKDQGQIADGIVNRMTSLIPEMTQAPHYRLLDFRLSVRLELNLKDQQARTCLFSATMTLPNGPWITALYKGVKSLGGRSFCTIAPADLHVETELSDNDQRLLRAVRNALGVDNATFRPILDLALGTVLRGDVRSREDTVHWTQTGGGKRTMEHVSPDSPESRMLVTMDVTHLIMARRLSTTLALQLGPVTVTITLMRCPPHVFHSVLAPRDPAALRLRSRGTITDSAIMLMGPLPKGSIPREITSAGFRMAELHRHMREMCQAELQTIDMRLVGRYDKDRSPMFLYMEFGSVDAARHFATMGDQLVPQEFGKLLRRLWGDKALDMSFWSCDLLAEILAVANEKEMKALMSHGQQHPCPLPPPALPPPPPPANGAGPVANGSESAASGPDNPANSQH